MYFGAAVAAGDNNPCAAPVHNIEREEELLTLVRGAAVAAGDIIPCAAPAHSKGSRGMTTP